ncbi:MAG: orotate phosphoribosyltransferase [Pseudomonadota bacterium]
MSSQRDRFLSLAIRAGALKFGEFTLKSGRVSPYFFNAGEFSSGEALATLGSLYADALVKMDAPFDMLFGPAYKGIPLVAVTAAALYTEHGLDVPYAYNRKEAKQHGEGGTLVGGAVRGRVAIIDDVITAGTAIVEAIDLIRAAGATPSAVAIALDRQEVAGTDESRSAIQKLEQAHGLQVTALATLDNLIDFVDRDNSAAGRLEALQAYRERYGLAALE